MHQIAQYIRQHIPYLSTFYVADAQQIFWSYQANSQSSPFRHNVRSIAKSIVAILMGYMSELPGVQAIEHPIAPILTKAAPKHNTQPLDAITSKHLLTMTTGWEWYETSLHLQAFFQSQDPLAYTLRLPMRDQPGAYFSYCTPATYLLTQILELQISHSIPLFAQENLGAPLGIQLQHWGTNPKGKIWGGTDLHLTGLELIRIAQYLLRSYQISYPTSICKWIKEVWSLHIHVEDPYFESFIPHIRGYGYSWWICYHLEQELYAALGYGGQFMLIYPQDQLLFAGTSVEGKRHPGNITQFKYIFALVERVHALIQPGY